MTTFERIKELAKKQGKSLNKVEEDLGWSRNTLYSLKVNKPSSERLETLADYFGVSVDYLLGRTDNPHSAESEDEYDDLVMMFRKNEMEIPEEKRDEYRREVEKLMDFVKFTMKELDEKNKNK
ncbi:helix-turn-helix transcriptional regulator [Enterococcus casseliflavus]|uniref:helix-turn-helix domain-containing protein n=1 Tax=Enterococcus TaxID=1350 RepID=UPI001E6417F0|nr:MULTISPECIES: helix-turn-helix transcriptional regulator [Enterococcus]MDU1988795.1 helix-turn-helix transcriptional regulator [Enterococcus faecalis]MCD5191864.1 helix-turn-helix transcriptional regulator [Enterococcus casseliflavus]MDT2695032.1 helix-turn-helix transcriptional regulator [Enterococcus gallinarum]MDT2980654.1 helix-turn-helix transcriptional regulator [Enterococcus casseliflavus]MDU5814257.1 helix-turn-helix transcriptional regulator [Enterococcus casseliflavus]